jgi:uncharacterized repeat protein (TIGR01451 family)
MATIFNQGTLTFTPEGGTQTTVSSNMTGTELTVTYALNVSHAASPQTYTEGDTVRYTVAMSNEGTGTLTAPTVTVDLAGGALQYLPGSAVALLYNGDTLVQVPFTVTAGSLIFDLDTVLPAGSTLYITYDVTVDQSALPAEQVSCTLVSTAVGTANEGSATGPVITDSDTATITCVPVSIVKSAPENVHVGDTATFTFTLSNNTASPVEINSLVDQLPAQFDLTAVTLTQGGVTTPLVAGTDYTLSGTTLTVSPAATLALGGGEDAIVVITGVITA